MDICTVFEKHADNTGAPLKDSITSWLVRRAVSCGLVESLKIGPLCG
jgi:hypothetical protein